LFAALDLGTNNCRLMIAARSDSGFRVVDSLNRSVRLGEGLQQSGCLSDAAMDRTIEVLHDCMDRIRRRNPGRIRAIATEACRRATNGRAFLDRVAHETGLGISVISGREEAELALESCTPLLSHHDPRSRALLFDIGGGSTEIAWVRLEPDAARAGGPRLISYVSAPVGVVTLAEEFGASIHTHAGYEAMVARVRTELKAFEQVHCITREIAQDNVRLLGTSGTVTTLAGIAAGLERYSRAAIDGVTMSRGQTDGAVRLLRSLDPAGLRAHPCIGRDRADYVLPGCAIFDAIRRTWPVGDVTVADRGLRDGMLIRMIRDAGSLAAPQRPPFRQARRRDAAPLIGAVQT